VARRILERSRSRTFSGGRGVHLDQHRHQSLPFDASNANDLIKNADGAMYQAKEQGRNGFQIYDESMNAKALERIILESQLHKRQGGGIRHLLPAPAVLQYRGGGGDRGAGEVNSSEFGMVEPAASCACRGDRAGDRDRPVGMRKACHQFKSWLDAGLAPVTLAVNVSVSTSRKMTFWRP